MYGWYKLLSESDDEMRIAYSFEKNDSCDGILSYNKKNDGFKTIKMSKGTDEWITRWISRHILSKIITGKISNTRGMIAAG